METLEELLEDICVENEIIYDIANGIDHNISDWYAVSNNKGIIAYFSNEVDACSFRLSYINRILNPIK